MREQKKKQKEEELMKKKAAAAERKAAAAEKKKTLEEKKAAAAERKKAAAEKKAAAQKRAVPVVREATTAGKGESDVENAETSTESEERRVNRKRPASCYIFREKRQRCDVQDGDEPSCSVALTTSGNVRENNEAVWQCSICFEQYDEGDDEDWVQCGCGRWTHESCISDIVIDASGKELFCPYCSV